MLQRMPAIRRFLSVTAVNFETRAAGSSWAWISPTPHGRDEWLLELSYRDHPSLKAI